MADRFFNKKRRISPESYIAKAKMYTNMISECNDIIKLAEKCDMETIVEEHIFDRTRMLLFLRSIKDSTEYSNEVNTRLIDQLEKNTILYVIIALLSFVSFVLLIKNDEIKFSVKNSKKKNKGFPT